MRDYYLVDPDEAAKIARTLGLAALGAMGSILGITYCEGRLLPGDDDDAVADALGCTLAEWKGLRQLLIAAGELVESGGHLLPASKWARPEVDG